MPVDRPNRGKHLDVDLTNYVVLDLETTGFSPAKDCIVEVGALKVRNNEVVETLGTLVRSPKPIPAFVSQKINIWNNMLVGKPTIGQVLPVLKEFIGDDILLAHNAHFDVNFLYDNFGRTMSHVFQNNFVDYVKVAKKRYTLDNYQLGTIAGHLGVEASGAHRAVDDCVILHKCYTDSSLKPMFLS